MEWIAVFIGVLVAGYWLRVLRMVHKTRRRQGHTAGLIPVEPLGRLIRIAWYPAVALWIAAPLIAGLRPAREPAGFAPLLAVPSVRYLAAIVAAAAFCATLVCWKKMGSAWRMGIDPNEKNTLIITGPYAWVRHPIYALSSLLMIASVAAVPSPVMIAAAVLHLAFLQWEARREERHMTRVHGDAYARYAAAVGGFVPRSLRPYAQAPATEVAGA